MNPIEKALLLTTLPTALAWGLRELQAWQRTKTHLLALAAIEDAAVDAVKAMLPTSTRTDAIAAARQSLLRDWPDIDQSVTADVDVLLTGHVATLTTTPGGATVAMPTLGAT
jgi:hypothetical protein